jgi:hypothetical protein
MAWSRPSQDQKWDILFRGQEKVLQLGQITKRFPMVSPRPVKVKSINTSLLRIEEIKLPVITHMDNLARLNAQLFTYIEVKIRALIS